MTKNNKRNQGGGMGILGWMFIVFLTLKLTNIIAWSWWWVTAPLWGIFALVFGAAFVALFGAGIIVLIQEFFDERRRKNREKKRINLHK